MYQLLTFTKNVVQGKYFYKFPLNQSTYAANLLPLYPIQLLTFLKKKQEQGK